MSKEMERAMHQGLTLRELIDELEDIAIAEGDDIKVAFSYNYGDYWKTQVAQSITRVEIDNLEYSSYHNMPKIADEEDKDTTIKAIVLS